MRRLILVLALAAAAGGPAALAQTAAPDSENGRYSFNQVADGLLRLDTRTGQVSLCANLPLPGGIAGAPSAEQQRELNLKVPLPSDAEIDRVMSAFEKMWRRLVDMVQKTPNSDRI